MRCARLLLHKKVRDVPAARLPTAAPSAAQFLYRSAVRTSILTMSLLNKGSRLMSQSLRAGARGMSSATEQEAKEQMHRWSTISKGMIGLVAVYTVYAINDHLSHEHHEEEKPAYPYLKMRTKPFPWPESDCDLLDTECRAKARAAKKALE